MPFTARYLEEIPKLAGGGMLKVFGLIRGMFPHVGDQEFLDAATAMARPRASTRPSAPPCSVVSTPSSAASERAASSTRSPAAIAFSFSAISSCTYVVGAVRVGGELAHQRQRLVVPAQRPQRPAHAPPRNEPGGVVVGCGPGLDGSLEDREGLVGTAGVVEVPAEVVEDRAEPAPHLRVVGGLDLGQCALVDRAGSVGALGSAGGDRLHVEGVDGEPTHAGLGGQATGLDEVRRRAGGIVGRDERASTFDGEPGAGVDGRGVEAGGLDLVEDPRGRREVAGQPGRARPAGSAARRTSRDRAPRRRRP
jgi:hypothetical protein